MTPQSTNESAEKQRIWLIISACLAAIIVFAAFISFRRTEVPVHAERATLSTIESTISTNGKIEPMDNFEAHGPAATTVKKIFVHEGDHVRRGQKLLQLDDAGARAQAARALAQLRGAEADLNNVHSGGTHEEVLTTESQLVSARTERDAAQRNLEAMRRLQQRGAASAGEVQQAEARLQKAQAEFDLLQQKQKSRYSSPEVVKVQAQAEEARASYAAAQELLRNSNIVSPRDGIVYSLPIREGAYVNSGDLLVQVANLVSVQVRAFVDEPDIGRLAKGQKVLVTWDALPGRTWMGEITRVPTTVTVHGTRTVGELTCLVNNQDLKLLPNVNVSVNVITGRHENVLTLPREAVHQNEGKRFVYEVSDGKLQRRYVETSLSNLTRVEVTSGINERSLIALGSINSQPLREGLPVRVVQR